jgi:hypothetical protein
VFEANGVADRVTLIPGWSRQIELPERADLLVAEVIGNEPLEEEILETTLDARRRLLKPGARLVPNALELLARPLLLPEAEIRQRVFGRAAVARWRGLYGMDFQPLLDAAARYPVYSVAEGEVTAKWPPAGPAAVLASVDLATFEQASVRAVADLVVDPPGRSTPSRSPSGRAVGNARPDGPAAVAVGSGVYHLFRTMTPPQTRQRLKGRARRRLPHSSGGRKRLAASAAYAQTLRDPLLADVTRWVMRGRRR